MNRSTGKLFRRLRQVARVSCGEQLRLPAQKIEVARRLVTEACDIPRITSSLRQRHPADGAPLARLRSPSRQSSTRVCERATPAQPVSCENRPARKSQFCEPAQSDRDVQSRRRKYFALSEIKSVPISRHLVLTRGADASSRTWSRDAMDGATSTDDCCCSGRQKRVVLISRRWDQVSQPMICEATVAKKPGTPGRARISR